MQTRLFLTPLLFICCILLSCTKDDESEGGEENSGGEIQFSGSCALRTVGGPTCSNGPGPIAFVTGVISGSYTGICSGVFISANKVLTAAHCLNAPGTLTVVTDDKQLPILDVAVHPKADNLGNYDVMVLTVPAQNNVSPLPLLLSEEVGIGDSIIVYGYGPEPGNEIDPSQTPPLGRADLHINSISPDELRLSAIRQPGESGGCAGDSGAPAIRSNRNGLFGIVALVSGGSNNTCEPGTINGYTGIQPNAVASFILQVAPNVGTI